MIDSRRLRAQFFAWPLAAAAMLLPPRAAAAEEPPVFEHDVRPILKTYCLDCHGGGAELSGQLDLRLRRFALKGGESGPAIVPGDAAASLLTTRMRNGEMPPTDKKVPPEKIAIIERWLASGAATLHDEPEQLSAGIHITAEERAFWAFQPPVDRAPPQLDGIVSQVTDLASQPGADVVRTPIDAFVLQKLRERGLRFAPDADKATLLRRAALDLTGLAPTPEELADYLADERPDAYEAALDRLLASPRYGERWGRHWLDVAGYADSEGNGSDDTPRPYAYKYRDYVVRALNADKPLDQFVIEQLAGDELTPQPWNNLSAEQIDRLAATGFLRMAIDGTAGGGDEAMQSNQMVADALKIVGASLLGLTVGCAQCHDHRYDPIPQTDYYRLRAVFEPALDTSHWRRPGQRLVSLYTDADRAKAAAVEGEAQKLDAALNEKAARYVAAAVEKEIQKLPEALRDPLRAACQTPVDKRTADQKQLLDTHPSVNISQGVLYQYDEGADKELKADAAVVAAKRGEKPVEDFVSIANEAPGVLPATHVFHRGDHRQPKQAVSPGDLTIAAPEGARLDIPEKDAALPTSGRRLAWARHLTDGGHPLFGRVLANRIWLHHFGRGIVDTPGDFGYLGVRPTHPELLDWLACELPRQGWSLKKFHKAIMLSTVYRQASALPATPGGVDPRSIDAGTAYYWRYPLRRLEAEAIRDRMLVAAGRLDSTMYGPSVPIEQDFVGQVVVKGDQPRRSIYIEARRTRPISFLTAFDAPVMTVNCERRISSAGAPQSLMLMNSDFVLAQAGHVAERVARDAAAPGATDPLPPDLVAAAVEQAAAIGALLPKQVGRAWQVCYGRAIEREEFDLACRFLAGQIAHLKAAGEAGDVERIAMTNLCQQLLSSNEFLHVD